MPRYAVQRTFPDGLQILAGKAVPQQAPALLLARGSSRGHGDSSCYSGTDAATWKASMPGSAEPRRDHPPGVTVKA